jgi:cytochrome c oxidase subunit 3
MAMDVAVAPAHSHAAHHEEGMSRGMAGMVLFIASEVMLFGGLFACYFYVRNQAVSWPPAGIEKELSIPTAAILSAILISSSVFAHVGILALRANNRTLFRIGIAGAIVLGTIFIGGQIYEWLSLMDEGLEAHSNVYGSTFYLITGFHGSHVIVGLLMLVLVFIRATWDDFTPSRHVFADAAVLYWHFVDVVWVFVFTIIYVSPKL